MGDKVGNSVGWFDGFSVVREIVGDTVGLSVASLASGDIDIDINILKKRFRGSTSCIDIDILKKRFRVSTSCSKRKNRIRNPKHNANGIIAVRYIMVHAQILENR